MPERDETASAVSLHLTQGLIYPMCLQTVAIPANQLNYHFPQVLMPGLPPVRLRLLALPRPPALARLAGPPAPHETLATWKTCCNIRLKHKKHLEHMLTTYV
jgi:hypothetical protein